MLPVEVGIYKKHYIQYTSKLLEMLLFADYSSKQNYDSSMYPPNLESQSLPMQID